MYDTERRQRVISSTPQLSPEEVASRTFGTKVRGYSDHEVRSFLKRVADQLTEARAREAELEAAVRELEEEVRAPRPLSEQELLDALGEETARLLRSAREASDEIRSKAEERANRIVEDAQARAEHTTADTAEAAASRLSEADTNAAAVVATAESHAADVRSLASSDSEQVLEAARQQGRDMLEEAKAARERVLTDLVRRRALLTAQIEELRTGRDHLLDAYRTVKRTFLEATEALAQVEVRAAEERTSPAEPIDIEGEIAAEAAALDAASAETEAVPPAVDAEGVDGDADATAATEIIEVEVEEQIEVVVIDDDAAAKLADVDSLFARLRAGQGAPDEEEPANAGEAGRSPAAAAAGEPVEIEELSESSEAEAESVPGVGAVEWRAWRAAAIDPVLGPLVKRAKRTVQDDQNALLDAVRRHKGRPRAEQVLPTGDAATIEWEGVLQSAVDEAYGAGRVAARGEVEAAPAALVAEAAHALVSPLRERLAVAIDTGEAGDTGGLVERIGARYREWKNQSLEGTLADVLAFAWSRGVYDAVPDGSVLWWVPFEEGHCSDCDDNALEPTVKGEHFPTGQPFPPAHPGCSCLLAPATLLKSPTA